MSRLSPLAQCEADIAATERHLEALRHARNYLASQAGARRQTTVKQTSISANDTGRGTRVWTEAQRNAQRERMKRYWATKGRARRRK